MTSPRRTAPWRRVDGVLLFDKPSGLSSNGALQRVRRLYAAQKAGHTGTLDPLASGLLPILFGEATKFSQYLLDAGKRYLACIRFGEATSTGDAEGEVIDKAPVAFDRSALEQALAATVGPSLQVPPRHSALKLNGRPLYAYARAGQEVERAPRPVVIESMRLVDWSSPVAQVDIACSKGTYVRVIAEDLGRRLGSAAHLSGLRRTASGAFRIDEARTLDAIEAASPDERDAMLLPASVLVEHLPAVRLDGVQAARFAHGVALDVRTAPQPVVRCLDPDGRLIGLGTTQGGRLAPLRLMSDAARG